MKLSFAFGSIPVRVHGSFLLMTILFGIQGMQERPQEAVSWCIVVFVSVLIHEMGHALMGKVFGLVPEIDLHGMGGTTSWPQGKLVSSGRQIAISLAGPVPEIAIGLAVQVWAETHPPATALAAVVLQQIIWVNLWWGILNLLPIMPLDGGNVVRAFLDMFTKGAGERPTRYISLVTAVGVGIYAFTNGHLYGGILVGLFAYQNVVALRAAPGDGDERALLVELQRAVDALQRDDGVTAARSARVVLAQSSYGPTRAEAARLLLYALLLNAAWGPLMDLMEEAGTKVLTPAELTKFESAAMELGRPEEARRIGELRDVRGVVRA